MKISKRTKNFTIGFVIYVFVMEFSFIFFESINRTIAVIGLTTIIPLIVVLLIFIYVDKRSRGQEEKEITK